MTQSEILSLIESGFAGIPYPGDHNIAGGPTSGPPEYAYVADYFRGKHWKDVSLSELKENYPGPCDACLSMMSPEAFRFFLPAYMNIAVKDFVLADTTGCSAIYSLTPPIGDASQKDWWERRVTPFGAIERRAIVAFLEYIQQKHAEYFPGFGLSDALKYWTTR